ncbi:MAG: penicillin-binding protein 2 [Thermoleophilaceae bacterium]|nr:penicillin-binding protein 2 [Thermoleophilaceae bacterium]
MNRQIVQLFGLSMILFAALVGFTSRWTVFEAEDLKDQALNRRSLIEAQQIPRGLIRAADGTVLARSVPRGSGQRRIFERTYPEGNQFAHAVGYSFLSRGSAGIERFRNDELTGEEDEFSSIFSELQSKQAEGSDVTTTLDMNAQRTALDALGGRQGAIVAIEPSTGRVRAMASSPDFDPNEVPDGDRFRQLNSDEEARPVVNRTTQANFQPGSTFKVVTAAAALDSGKFTPDSIVDGSSGQLVSGVPLANFGGQDFGSITLTDALTNSVNTVWAQVGEQVGRKTLVEYMSRFGFNSDPPLDYPEDQMNASGIRNAEGRLVDGDDGFDAGRVAIGQGGAEGQIQVTPLQMAMVASAVGNGGKLMRPQLTEKVVAPDGRVEQRFEPQEQSRVMSAESAGALAQMMSRVVEEGTGTAAALSGVPVAGKTGTAEVAGAQLNQLWFIGFAPVENPQVAVAVTLEDQPLGTQGGQVAAPLAAQVMETLLR